MTEPVRLAKRVAEISACSRREAEIFIEGGWVTVDGKVVREPQFRVAEQLIAIDPEAKSGPVELVTILFHQSAGEAASNENILISPDNRAADDASGINSLKRHFSKLDATLPLDRNASGLMVYTQDWRVVRKLVDDARTVEQEYIVEVAVQNVADANTVPDIHALKRLNHGLSFNGRALGPAKVSWQNETRLRFAVKGPAPGQIAHVCESVGYQVRAMKRIRIGKISMAKLPLGQWRYLPPGERF